MARPMLLSAALLAALPAITPLPAQTPARVDLKASIDSFLDSRVAADSFSGTVLVATNGRIVYQRAAGAANRETGASMTIETRLQIASISKLYTQIAIRQLEQAGKLALSDTVGKFLPRYPNAAVRSKVTVEQLLRHQSGIGSFWNERYMARLADLRTANDYLTLFQHDSLLFQPGTSVAYSNGGYVVLGAIIESVSGKSYHDYLRERVFGPAGMNATQPYDRRVSVSNAAVGYTGQELGAPMTGDRRLAGPAGPRPGYGQSAPSAPSAPRTAPGGVRRPNTVSQPGVSSPAGNHYSTVGDFLRLANALTSRRLLDSTRTAALLGSRYATGNDFRANGGGPGVNAEFSIYPSGDVLVVLSNLDPPAATTVAQYVRGLLAVASGQTTESRAQLQQPGPQASLRAEIDALHAAMVVAFKRDPASVAQFYTDDASILGGGGRWVGREQLNRYWSQGPTPTDWNLEVLEVGGDSQAPWVRGRSTLVGQGGRQMVTDYVGILKRQPDGRLKFYVDMFVGSPSVGTRTPGGAA